MTPQAKRAMIDKWVRQAGGIEAIREAGERHERQRKAFEARRKELTKKYPDQWVVFYGDDVVAVAGSFDELRAKLDALTVPRGETILEFLETKPSVWVL